MSLRTILLVLTGSVCACANHCPNTGFTLICAQGGSGIAKIDTSASERKFLLIPFSAPSQESDSALPYDLQIDTTSKTAAVSSPRLTVSPPSTLSEKIVARIQAESRRRAVDQISIEKAVRSFRSDPAPFRRLLSPRAASTAPRDVTTTISIFSPFDGEEGTKLTGNLRVKSAHTAIYVDSRVDLTVADADVKAMMQGFDNITLPRLHVLFGAESDVDGNGVVNVFLAAPEKVGSNVIGFFRPTDLLPDGTVSGVRSNVMEIVYVRTPGAGFDFSLAQATLAHEIFHLINFAQKSLPLFRASVGTLAFTEAIFLNEGQAHLAEDLTGWGVGTPDLIKIYLKCIGLTSLAGGGTTTSDDATCRIAAAGSDSIPRRGAAMLLLLYMFQQLGGATFSTTTVDDIQGDGIKFLKKLSSTTSIGLANLEESSNRTFFFWYADFAGVLALDNTNGSTDPRYHLVSPELDPFTNFYRYIRLRSSRVVDGNTVTWEGPLPSHEITAGADTKLSDSLFVTGLQATVLTVPANLQAQITASANSHLALGLAIVPMP
ncbi:MAG: hypothetical protein V1495_04545 [Pseudomonadota bacterium]